METLRSLQTVLQHPDFEQLLLHTEIPYPCPF